jgi:SHS2 domain-containing protein
MTFEQLPHTADIYMRIRAPTLEGLFVESLRALMEIMYGQDRIIRTEKVIEVKGSDTESLLANFLSEVLFVTEVDGLVAATGSVTIDGLHLTAILCGEAFDPARHSEGTEVKGISYTGLAIAKEAEGYVVEVVFDV